MDFQGVLSKLLTFLSGCSGTVAAIGVVGGADMGMPKWLILVCIVLTGGFAKASIGAIPPAGAKENAALIEALPPSLVREARVTAAEKAASE
jgi:hypothetical protein